MPAPAISNVERTDEGVIRIDVDACSDPSWEFWLGVTSDRHHDNGYCRRDAEKYHLDLGVERGAAFIDVGDWLCLMQGKGDPRSDRRQIAKAQERRQDYFDSVIEEASTFFGPYAPNLLAASPGNHEWQYGDRHGTNATERFAERIKWETGHKMWTNPLQGWYKVRFHYQSTHTQAFNFLYHHGYGGGGPVTGDMIQANRLLAANENADFILFGHTHDAWHRVFSRTWLNDNGVAQERNTSVIKIGGYKDEHKSGSSWANLKGHPAKPIGGYWIRFYFNRGAIRYQVSRMEDY